MYQQWAPSLVPLLRAFYLILITSSSDLPFLVSNTHAASAA